MMQHVGRAHVLCGCRTTSCLAANCAEWILDYSFAGTTAATVGGWCATLACARWLWIVGSRQRLRTAWRFRRMGALKRTCA